MPVTSVLAMNAGVPSICNWVSRNQVNTLLNAMLICGINKIGCDWGVWLGEVGLAAMLGGGERMLEHQRRTYAICHIATS